MNGEQTALWQRIEAFAIDDPSVDFSFASRLAQENGWSRDYALRVVDEYKRFVFLAMVAGHEVTPSEDVDQAWHLHMVYTRSYWDELCGKVLGQSLHHGPTKGGNEEGERFADQYRQTLADYQRWFQETAPKDIWPPTEKRFAKDQRFVRVNLASNWVLNKRAVLGVVACLALAFVAIMLVAAAAPEEQSNASWFYVFLAFVLVGVICLLALRGRDFHLCGKKRSKGSENATGGSCGGFFIFGCSSSHGGSGCGGNSGCGGSGCGGGGCGGGGCGSS